MKPDPDRFIRVGSLAELEANGRMVVKGRRCPLLVVHDQGRVFALDDRCPHLGFALHKGSIRDGILTCPWHHARFDLASGGTFDLWADDVPTAEVRIEDGQVFVAADCGLRADPATHWRRRLDDGMAHNLGLVIAKAVLGARSAGVDEAALLRDAALFGARMRDGFGIGMTILVALGNSLPELPAPSVISRCSTVSGASPPTAPARRRGANAPRSRALPLRSRCSAAGSGSGPRCVTGTPRSARS
jgi:nitrite reductase/ring-hydroxylating ferredoxin subunit